MKFSDNKINGDIIIINIVMIPKVIWKAMDIWL